MILLQLKREHQFKPGQTVRLKVNSVKSQTSNVTIVAAEIVLETAAGPVPAEDGSYDVKRS